MQSRHLAYTALLLNVLIWGGALPVVKPALEVISPFAFLFYRYVIASICLLPLLFLFKSKLKKIKLEQFILIVALEFLQLGIGLSLLYKGLELTAALNASLISSTSPILITLGGIFFLKERQEKNEWLGLLISVIGSLTVIVTPFIGNHRETETGYVGNILVMLYVISWMAYSLLAKRHYRRIDKGVIAVISCYVGLISFAVISPVFTTIPSPWFLITSGYPLLATIYMGTFGSAIAVGLFLYGQSKVEASEATLFSYLQPLIYIPLAVLWLGDHLYPAQLLGLILIAIGVIIAEKRTSKR